MPRARDREIMYKMYTVRFFGLDVDGRQVGPEIVSCPADNDKQVIAHAKQLSRTSQFAFGQAGRALPVNSFTIYKNDRLVYSSAGD